MEKRIEDYLHFYYKYLGCELIKPVYAENENTKPILRNINTLTNDEAEEIGFDSSRSFHESNYDYIDKIGLLRPIDFKFLVDKGFDLFNLIPSGLAIDKSKIISPNTK